MLKKKTLIMFPSEINLFCWYDKLIPELQNFLSQEVNYLY